MSGEQELKGPDLAAGVSVSTIPEGGILLGHAPVSYTHLTLPTNREV